MKTALLLGCGSKFGLDFLKILLNQGWQIYSISGSYIDLTNKNLYQQVVDWKTINVADIEKFLNTLPEVELILFNQNSSALSEEYFKECYYKTLGLWKQEKVWNQSYFVSCILPFHIIHSLKTKCKINTKIIWMLSSYIYKHTSIKHPDYIGNKYQNYLIMKNFSEMHRSCFFGINPNNLNTTNTNDGLTNLIKFINDSKLDELNGKVINFDTSIDTNFQNFNV